MIAGIITSLIGGPIAKALLSGYKAKLDAANTSERIATDLAIKDIEAGIEAKKHAKEIRLATAGFTEMRLLTFLIALPFVEHLWAVWMDTRFGVFQKGGAFERCWQEGANTVCGVPAFPSPFVDWQGAIILSFFGLYGGVKAVQTIGAVLASRRG